MLNLDMGLQILLLLIVFGAIGALNPGGSVGVELANVLMWFEVFDLLDHFLAELAGQILVFIQVHLHMLS